MDLAGCSAFLRVLSDPTRVRLLALIEREELTVAELAAVTRLAQPRVSTHLAKLKEAGIVRDRWVFRLAVHLRDAERALKAGEYRFDRPATPFEVVDRLARGEDVRILVNMPGFSLPSRLSTLPRTMTDRLTGSMRLSILATLPSNMAPG